MPSFSQTYVFSNYIDCGCFYQKLLYKICSCKNYRPNLHIQISNSFEFEYNKIALDFSFLYIKKKKSKPSGLLVFINRRGQIRLCWRLLDLVMCEMSVITLRRFGGGTVSLKKFRNRVF